MLLTRAPAYAAPSNSGIQHGVRFGHALVAGLDVLVAGPPSRPIDMGAVVDIDDEDGVVLVVDA